MMQQRLLILGALSLIGVGFVWLLWTIMAPGVTYIPGAGLTLLHGQDFLNYWGAPQLDVATLFAGPGYEEALRTLYPQALSELRWSYPLHSLFFFAPFAALPYVPALCLWLVFGLSAYVASVWYALPLPSRRSFLMFLVIAPITLVEFSSRQNGFFVGAAALGVLVLIERQRPIAAGILLGCLTIKPQLFILWPLMLILQREWRVIVAAGITAGILIAASLLVHGVQSWEMFFVVVPKLQMQVISAAEFEDSRKLTHLMMPSLVAALRILEVPDGAVLVLQVALSLSVAFIALHALRQPLELSQRALILSSASLLITPYFFNYDMTLFMAAILLRWATRPVMDGLTMLRESIAYLLPLLVYIFNVTDVPLSPIILLLVFWGAVREAKPVRAL